MELYVSAREAFGNARLNARLSALENSDGESIFADARLNARLFHSDKSDGKSAGTTQKCGNRCGSATLRATLFIVNQQIMRQLMW